jgi:hypothetical protein
METMLVTMKTLNMSKLKKEFLMLTAFHGHKFCDEVSNLEGVDDHVKDGFKKVVRDFMHDLFEMAEFDSEELAQEVERNSAFFTSQAAAA